MEAKEAREEEEEVTVAKAERVVVSVAKMAAAVRRVCLSERHGGTCSSC